jgi:hypothetical protein
VAVITKKDLEIAFRKTLSEEALKDIDDRLSKIDDFMKKYEGDAKPITEELLAEFIISLFGFDNAVIDNRLATHDRDMLYKLEEYDLVHTQQEEVTITKGKVWRLHYWFLNRNLILKLSRGENEPEKGDEFAVYTEMDEDVWARHNETK